MPQAIINAFFGTGIPPFPGPAADFHLDATQLTGLAHDDPVATWFDISGNGRDFSQATAANRPLYKTNSQNGLPAVDFISADSLVASTLPAGGSIYTMFIAADSDSGVTQFVFYWGTTSNGMGMGQSSPNIVVQHRNGGATVNCLAGLSTSTPEAWTARRTTTGPLLEFWRDGVSEAITNSGSALGALTAAGVVGAFNPAAPSANWDGRVFEVIGYASVLSNVDRAAIESYLISKWAL